MKTLIGSFILLFLSSCDKAPTFKVGDCVQKPDSMVVWKVDEISKEKMTLVQNQNPQMEKSQETEPSGDWIQTSCPE